MQDMAIPLRTLHAGSEQQTTLATHGLKPGDCYRAASAAKYAAILGAPRLAQQLWNAAEAQTCPAPFRPDHDAFWVSGEWIFRYDRLAELVQAELRAGLQP